MSPSAKNYTPLWSYIILWTLYEPPIDGNYSTSRKEMEDMKIKIEYGTTVISTGDAAGGNKNKNGHPGIHLDRRTGKYRAQIDYQRRRYHLGYSNNIEELIAIRQEADLHVEHGDFLDWIRQRKARRGKKN